MGNADAVAVLLELTRALTEDQPLEDALRAVTDAALQLLPAADHASLRLLDAQSAALLCGARSGVGLEHRPIGFAPGKGVMGWAVEHDASVRIDDARSDARFLDSADQGFAVRSLLVEPLRAGGRVIGVLSISAAAPSAFGEADALLCRLIANCSVPPIERQRLVRLAMTDDMTLAYNQRYLRPRLAEEVERARRHGQPLGFALLDLDHFKAVNDAHGHAAGDVVLRLFANEVRAHVRRIDVFIRRGGEEFVLLMPATTLEQARALGDRIRETLRATPLAVSPELRVRQTVSIGVAEWDGAESPEELEGRADAALYEAKRQGRDRVAVAKAPAKAGELPAEAGTW